MRHHSHPLQKGFTLIEVMVVIVIMGIMASLVILNVGGVDQRKAMQAREVFLMDVQRVLREANDQSRILALDVRSATDVAPFSYNIQEYLTPVQQNTNSSTLQKWQNYSDFKTRFLPDQVAFQIESLSKSYPNAQNRDLIEANAPKLIWLGNGEVKPVRIQFFFENREIGQPIEIDHLGKINAS